MLFLSPCLAGAALRPAVRRDTRLLGLVAASAADSISSFAKSQLAGTGELLVDPGEELADSLEELKQQQREARRLRRSWDSRLSWRLRKQKAAAAAEPAGSQRYFWRAWCDGAGCPKFGHRQAAQVRGGVRLRCAEVDRCGSGVSVTSPSLHARTHLSPSRCSAAVARRVH